MQIKYLTPEQNLSVPCPVCAAAPQERCCELRSGTFRYEEHLARLLSAAGRERIFSSTANHNLNKMTCWAPVLIRQLKLSEQQLW